MFGIKEKELNRDIGIIIGGKIKAIDDIRNWGCTKILDDVRMAMHLKYPKNGRKRGAAAMVLMESKKAKELGICVKTSRDIKREEEQYERILEEEAEQRNNTNNNPDKGYFCFFKK